MNRLFIAEKHEVAKAIANVLGSPRRGDGCYNCGDDTVTWCAGHMLELFAPEDYDPSYKKWSLEQLPMIFVPWRYKIIPNRKKQLKIIKALLDKTDLIVHAGDTDGEGQLLVDEILSYYSVEKPVKRVLINDNNDKIIRRAIDNLRDNSDFEGLSKSALARSVADQLYGFNMTRLYTLKGQESGSQNVLSVGRVQTPILGLIVNRDKAIEGHVKNFYFPVFATFIFDDVSLKAKHKPSTDAPVDDKANIIDKSYAESITVLCKDKPSVVSDKSDEVKDVPPPLPYDLLELQVDASRKFGIKPDKVLKITQRLREVHKLITYNRSDCRYLSDEQHLDAPNVLSAISENSSVLFKACSNANPSVKGRAFNSANVTAHHAIIPTEARKSIDSLDENEKRIYLLIARAYIAQFFPLKKVQQEKVVIHCENEIFTASKTKVLNPGWQSLYKNDQDNQEIEDGPAADECEVDFSRISKGLSGMCSDCSFEEKETQPPKPYTMASLLKDLKRVSKYVKDLEIAKLLKDKDKDKKGEHGGIGTPATRDSFIVKLIDRGFIEEKGKTIRSTKLGRTFHDSLPSFATTPDMTALWHQNQKEIEKGTLSVNHFIDGMIENLSSHISEVVNSETTFKDDLGESVPCECGRGRLSRVKGKYGWFWPCSSRECKISFKDKRGKIDKTPKQNDATEHACKSCDNGHLIRRVSTKKKKGKTNKTVWYGCSNFPECKQTYFDDNGKPKYEREDTPSGDVS